MHKAEVCMGKSVVSVSGPRQRSVGEEIGNSVTQGIALALSMAGSFCHYWAVMTCVLGVHV